MNVRTSVRLLSLPTLNYIPYVRTERTFQFSRLTSCITQNRNSKINKNHHGFSPHRELDSYHVAILPTPGIGHLIPLIEFAKKLLQQREHNFTVTFIIPNDNSPMKLPQKALLEALPSSINYVFLPSVSCDNLPDDAKIETIISHSVIKYLPSIYQVLMDLNQSKHVSAFVVDLFGSFAFDLVKELSIPLYIFYTCSAMVLPFSFHLPQLFESTTCEHSRDLVKLPGCVTVHSSDLPDSVQDRKNEAYKMSLEMTKKYALARGILINSFLDLEPDTFKALEQSQIPVYPVGPLIQTGSTTDISDSKAECLKWLDEQPARSVLYVSFGSGGTLSREQLKELALGLEMSQQRFLLVAQGSNDKARNGAYFTSTFQTKMDSLDYLTIDFIERTKSKGFILSQWAPQIEILGHSNVGGFMTHCGWNSTLESIAHGVPLIAWPLYAEQKMNAVLLAEHLKVAFRVGENENGIVESEQISNLARSLIEGEGGEELRNRMRNLKNAASQVLTQAGSSTASLAKVAETWATTAK